MQRQSLRSFEHILKQNLSLSRLRIRASPFSTASNTKATPKPSSLSQPAPSAPTDLAKAFGFIAAPSSTKHNHFKRRTFKREKLSPSRSFLSLRNAVFAGNAEDAWRYFQTHFLSGNQIHDTAQQYLEANLDRLLVLLSGSLPQFKSPPMVQDKGLHPTCLKFMIEAHHRISNGAVDDSELYEYLSRHNIQLTSELCNMFMEEYAIFGNLEGARKLMARMKVDGIVPSLATYESLVVALTRHVRLDIIERKEFLELLEDMKKYSVKPSVQLFNSLIRWMAEDDVDWNQNEGNGLSALSWFDRMLEEGLVPNLSTATILVQLELKAFNATNEFCEEDYIVRKSSQRQLDTAFAAVENGEIKAIHEAQSDVTISALVERLTKLVLKHGGRNESAAAFVIIVSYLTAQKRVNEAVSILFKMRKMQVRPTSRIYGELLRGALLANNEALVNSISKEMIVDNISPDKYVYHQLIKADFQRGKFEDGLKLLDSLCQLDDDVRSQMYNVDDHLLSDLLTCLGNMGEYEMIFVVYQRIKETAETSIGPLSVSKVLSYTVPRYATDGTKLSDSIPSNVDPSNASLTYKEPSRPNRTTNYYPPISPLQLLSEYTSQSSYQLDTAVCSSAISALIRSKMPASVIPELLQKFESCGMKITPILLCYIAEAFARARNLEGVQWVIRILNETGTEMMGDSPTAKREVWKRVWMAYLSAGSKLGNVDAVEGAIRGICSTCIPKQKRLAETRRARAQGGVIGDEFDLLDEMDRARILRAIDGLLGAKARGRDSRGCKSLLEMMRDQKVVPSLQTLKVLFTKGLEADVNEVMGIDWLKEQMGGAYPTDENGTE
ncbi:hypothetical protein BCR33DRAFT_717668 [Rhizoclosmatium globosum]|uniref:Pentacotripeptide-repeat region of PRORP domain-containing protein n=1 Tax=Rhizoclosmatium globosum TaxID=329046 RepID=A0A1Y2C8V1_9FUNG|nr:hypothetical protein BCR33DRAFT_717668 [Rhizoclosmatium globosum]|eukprot:ORY43463.1 hypothetical protein BCR33DRAFT_717668 [Rhizoclosmatium globosum]